MKRKTKLRSDERDRIAVWLSKGLSQRIIAKKLNRSASTINDEVKRNGWKGNYVAIHAQRLATERKSKASRRYPLKDKRTYGYVLEKIRYGWSPEQISGRLKTEFEVCLHWETIYRFIYDPQNKDKKLWEYLPWKRKRRRQKFGRQCQRVTIPNRTSIHLRSEAINNRKEFGHWEGDSIIGLQTRGKVIHTEVERKTRYLQARLINSKSSVDTIKAQKQIFGLVPTKTVTTDNGLEFIKHQQLNFMGIKTYFADPYSSWQRGTNEYHNGLIRRYLPKKTSFNKLTQNDIDDIVEEINNRPRKVLKFRTPQEMLESELETTRCSDSI